VTDAKKDLVDLTEQLRRRIAAAPKGSFTAQQAADQIDDLERVAGLTPEQKAAALRQTLRDFGRNLQFSDPIHHLQGCAPERHPLRPVKRAGGG
jgi:hypothetical protein